MFKLRKQVPLAVQISSYIRITQTKEKKKWGEGLLRRIYTVFFASEMIKVF